MSKVKFHSKRNMDGENTFLDFFRLKFEKTLKSAPLSLSKCKLCGKKKELLNLGPKMLFSFFFLGGGRGEERGSRGSRGAGIGKIYCYIK